MASSSTPSAPPATSSLPPRTTAGGHSSLGTILGATAIVLAVIALVLGATLPPAPSSSSGAPPPVLLTAVVSSSGTVVRGAANNSTHDSTGVYTVYFPQYLNGCSWQANPGTTAFGVEPAARATVSPLPVPTYGVKVSTFNTSTGASQDSDFHLVGTCPGGLWASVGSTGTYEDGAQVSGVQFLSTGTYAVNFTRNVWTCVYIASLQSGSGSATTARYGANPHGVWINTYDPSGAPVNASFTLTVYC